MSDILFKACTIPEGCGIVFKILNASTFKQTASSYLDGAPNIEIREEYLDFTQKW
ncbi:hypothetical protein [Petrotoga sp. SL27]|uniref:hypothetical protein n=1 Tax=Petrotoga sp. SL27 TaxID=1445612 RepID=UPI001E3AB087|nr:hypothetical protein [Petrotoga sp. SL27]